MVSGSRMILVVACALASGVASAKGSGASVLADYLSLPTGTFPFKPDDQAARRVVLGTIDEKNGYLASKAHFPPDFELALFLTTAKKQLLGVALDVALPRGPDAARLQRSAEGDWGDVTAAVLPVLDEAAIARVAKPAPSRGEEDLCADDDAVHVWRLPRHGTALQVLQGKTGAMLLELQWDKATGVFRAPKGFERAPALRGR